MSRVITGRAARTQLADILQAMFVTEFLQPGPRLILHASSFGNPPVVDNRCNPFRTLLPDLGYRDVRLAEAIAELLARGSAIDLGVRADRSRSLLEQVETLIRRDRPPGELRLLCAGDLPGYGVLSSTAWLEGELEWSSAGLPTGPGGTVFHTAATTVATVREKWEAYWERNAHAADTIR